jgi:membrane-bound metal-dependent hydrolase YbcI (DUF457 family)
MYAINHAATALLLAKKQPRLPLLPLLVSVQLVELLWVLFNFIGWEHFSISDGKLHLDFLPYSHSLFSGVLLALASFIVIYRFYHNRRLAIAFAVGVMSHIIIDLLFHEKDIRLWPFSTSPVWGLGIIAHPVLNFIIELAYGVFCCWYFKGSRALLIVVIVFNVLNLPMMLAKGPILQTFVKYPLLLPSVILFQIVITWYFVYRYAHADAQLKKTVPDKIMNKESQVN